MANEFIRVPPDSTGKKVRNNKTLDIDVTNVVEELLNNLKLGDYIVSTSGGNGFFSGYKISGRNVFTVFIIDHLGTFNVNDDLSFNGVIWGRVIISNEIYSQNNVLTDKNTPNNTLKIDDNGSGFFRFNDGNVNLDVFGNLKVTGATTLKAYEFYYGRGLLEFNEVTGSGGTIIDDITSSQLKLTTDTTVNSKAQVTSYLYFPYTPQHSNTAVFSIASGDVGKTNVVRRWGLYDDNDGVYFELNGTQLSVNIKSSITNTVTTINQGNFNKHPLVSSVFDIFELDISKYNFFWITYQWQGIGVVKFGTYTPEGERIVLQAFENANKGIVPYMRRGTLPIRLEQFNIGITASGSEMKSSCINVERDSEKLEFVGDIYTAQIPTKLIGNTSTPIVVLNLKPTFGPLNNTAIIQPIVLEFFSETEPIIVEVIINNTLVGESYQQISKFSNLDVSSTGTTGGIVVDRFMLGSGVNNIIFDNDLTKVVVNREYIVGNKITIAVKTVRNGTTSNVSLIGKWKEII